MLHRLTRREFMERSAKGAAVVGLGPGVLLQKQPPKIAIASWEDPQEDPDAIKHEAQRLTEEAVKALGGMSRFISGGDVVFIKPNIGWDRLPAQAANTNPDVVATLVRLCFEAGAGNVRVSDHPCNDQRRTFVRSGIKKAAEEEGAEVFFMDRRKFRDARIGGENLMSWPTYTDYIECDKRINVPIAKHHSLTSLTLTIKNLMGILGDPRNRLHQNLGPAMADVAKFVPSDLVVLDAIRILKANGPTGGNLQDVERRDILVAGTDTVAIDAYGTTLFGMAPDSLSTTREAAKLGLGTINFESLDPVRLNVS
ncbi:MAG: DUF362 domain-containing protein [Candidatus Latescibacteria bacterium]|nr:DUF362 domain-containing protein [Candidatus Latescibacterota bacterium]